MPHYYYRQSERYLWTVGHDDAADRFQPESDHDNPEDAAARVAWLNGGSPISRQQAEEKDVFGQLRELIDDLKALGCTVSVTVSAVAFRKQEGEE